MSPALIQKASEAGFFFKRMLRNPRQLGAIVPSSERLGRLMAEHMTWQDGSPVVELGGGTGALTRSLLAAGIPAHKLYVVELDREFCAYLHRNFPGVNIIHGSATELAKILPQEIIGRVKSVISGLPMKNFPQSLQTEIIHSAFDIMESEGALYQYTYTVKGSLDDDFHQLSKKKVGQIMRNIPPATVWRYTKSTSACDVAA